ncbi:hypothetical protein CROQUDRAFT_674013 [Cronartium quercuum f. sp. fusiforme G11]|uniref:4'-phosphopantetheinyl transferase domain-containing protein n=1 Tax=Cronartium quercuum f. sp. fusiforme G11 TaxID=708437 RepID=A0A9P6N9R8_9BASI|nr:hypothetical protein CROQUDRAFT_674013 [Cronartium quercuum f. sp. fusiforme G11]
MKGHIFGVGIDILDIRRLHRIVSRSDPSRSRFIKRILSSEELSSTEWKEIVGDADDTSKKSLTGAASSHSEKELLYLANRWTAKEAAFKALYPFYRPTWKELNVLKNQPIRLAYMFEPSNLHSAFFESLSFKKPTIHFRPELRSELPMPLLNVSISHDGNYVVAIVVASSPPV